MGNFLNYHFFGNPVSAYLTFVAIFIGGLVLINLFQTRLCKKLKEWTQKTNNSFDDFFLTAVEKKLIPLLQLALLYFSVQTLTLSQGINKVVNMVGWMVLMILGVRFFLEILVFILETIWVRKEEDPSRRQAFKGIISFIKLIIWGMAFVLLLDNLGVKVSALMAGLGIGGIAVALAAQAVLGDLFSYITIFFDRPFEIGDFIVIGDFIGTVEHTGVKTTRLRSLGGEQVIFSNTDLTNSRVRNYKRMERRRVVFRIGVGYQTRLDLLKEIPVIIQSIINGIADTAFDRSHFAAYGDNGLVFETVYFVLGSNYNQYMDIQQEINLRIMEEFQQRGVVFTNPAASSYHSFA